MSDDLITGATAGRLRLLPAVRRLYPVRPAALQPIRTVTGLVSELLVDDAVRTREGAAEVAVGIDGSASAIEAGRACVDVVREAMPEGARAVRVRIVAVD